MILDAAEAPVPEDDIDILGSAEHVDPEEEFRAALEDLEGEDMASQLRDIFEETADMCDRDARADQSQHDARVADGEVQGAPDVARVEPPRSVYLDPHPACVLRRGRVFYVDEGRGVDVHVGHSESLGAHLFKAVCKLHPSPPGSRKRCAFFLAYNLAPNTKVVECALHHWLCHGYEQGLSMDDHMRAAVDSRKQIESKWLEEREARQAKMSASSKV
jgi:hypothetical protein